MYRLCIIIHVHWFWTPLEPSINNMKELGLVYLGTGVEFWLQYLLCIRHQN